jgi:hypothetical protein
VFFNSLPDLKSAASFPYRFLILSGFLNIFKA